MKSTALPYREQIITLWSMFLLGTLFHTQLALIPLFHGLNVTHSQALNLAEIMPILWLMLSFFLVPIGLILGVLRTDSYRYRKLHFGVTLIYTILNFAHTLADLLVPPIVWPQVMLMLVLLGMGLQLNWVGFRWVQKSPVDPSPQVG
jgi:hypothetical protein